MAEPVALTARTEQPAALSLIIRTVGLAAAAAAGLTLATAALAATAAFLVVAVVAVVARVTGSPLVTEARGELGAL